MNVVFEPTLLQVLTLVASFGIPVLVGLVTTRVTNSGVKASLLAGLTLVLAVINEAIAAAVAGVAFDLAASIYTFAGAFVIAVASHFGLWKPTGVTDKVQAVGARHSA